MPTPPKNPEYFDKVNYVIDAWSHPCEAPWYIYVSTIKPALLAAFITLITFGWDDVARGYMRPPDRHSRRRTGKQRPGRTRPIRGFPEVGELLGRQLPGSEQVKGIKWSCALKTLWRIDTLIQGVLFAWLVADVAEDFAFEFTSLLYETRWCQASSAGRFSWRKGLRELVPPSAWNEIAYTEKDYGFPMPNWLVTWGLTGIKGATITYCIDWEPYNPALPPTSYTSRLIDIDTGEVFDSDGPEDSDDDGNATHCGSADVPRGRRFGVQGWSEGAWAYAAGGVIIGMEDLL